MSADQIASFCSTAASLWLPVFLDLAIKSLVVLAGPVLLTWLLWRASAAMRHLVWCVAVASLMALPALSFTLPHWLDLSDFLAVHRTESKSLASPRHGTDSSSSAGSLRGPLEADDAVEETLPGSTVTTSATTLVPASFDNAPAKGGSILRVLNEPSLWLFLGWLLGMGFFFAMTVLGMLRLRLLSRSSQPITAGPLEDLVRASARRLGVTRPVRVLQSGHLTMPMTWGLFSPCLLVPHGIDRWPAERRRVVVVHELAHVKRWDFLTQLFTQAACIVYWFNPLIWLASRRMKIERERACDDLVLGAGFKPSDYAEHLLSIASTHAGGQIVCQSAIPMARHSELEGRLLAVLDTKRNRRVLTRTMLAFGLVGVCCLSAPLAMVSTMALAEEDQKSPSVAAEGPKSVERSVAKEAAGETANSAGELATGVATDLYGDPLPEGAIARMGTVRLRHKAIFVESVAFSPKGDLLASGGHDSKVRVWNPTTAEAMFALEGFEYRPTCVLISPDGKSLAATDEHTGSGREYVGALRVFDLASKLLLFVSEIEDGLSCLAYSTDGSRLVGAGEQGIIYLFDAKTGEQIRRFEGHEDWIRAVAFSPDGNTIASGSDDGTARLWEVETGEELLSLNWEDRKVSDVVFPNDETLTIVAEEIIELNLATGEQTKRFDYPSRIRTVEGDRVTHTSRPSISKVRYAPDGKSIAGASTSEIVVWDLESAERLAEIDPQEGVRDFAFSPDSRRLAWGGWDCEVRLWDWINGRPVFDEREGHNEYLRDVVYLPDSKRWLSIADGSLRTWEATTGRALEEIPGGLPGAMSNLAVSPDEKLAVATVHHGIRVWDLESLEAIHDFQHKPPPDDLLEKSGVRGLSLQGWGIRALGFAPDGKTLLAIDADAKLWRRDLSSGRLLSSFQIDVPSPELLDVPNVLTDTKGNTIGPSRLKMSASWKYAQISSNGSWAVLPSADKLYVVDVATGDVSREIKIPDRGLWGLIALSPDGFQVSAACLDITLRVWDTRTGKQLQQFPLMERRPMSLAFSLDGTLLAAGIASGDQARIPVWNIVTGKRIHTFRGHEASTDCLAFGTDSPILASGHRDSTLLIWDLSKMAGN